MIDLVEDSISIASRRGDAHTSSGLATPTARVVTAGALLILALAFIAYSNAWHGPFVYDDVREVLQNPSISDLSHVRAVLTYAPTRPLVNLSYALDYAVGGLDTAAYHLTNILLHLTNVVLLFALVRRFGQDVYGPDSQSRSILVGLFTAGLFAVHPLQTEAVTFIASRSEVLCTTFVLVSLLAFREAFRTNSVRRIGVAVALLTLAIASKETAAVVPAILLVFEWLVLDGNGRRWRCTRLYLPLAVAAAILGLARMWLYLTAEHAAGAAVQWQNVPMELHVVTRYMSLLLFPISQSAVPAVSAIHSWADPRLLAAVGILVGLAVVAFAIRRREPLVTFGIAWFFVFLVPSAVLTLIADDGQLMAEHRVYLPSCGFFLAITAAASSLLGPVRGRPRRAIATGALATAVLLTLGGMTYIRNRVWSDPVLLWQDAVDKAPHTWMAHFLLGTAYSDQGDHPSARASFERAISIRPDLGEAYVGLAQSYAATGQPEEGRKILVLGSQRAGRNTHIRLTLARFEDQIFHDRSAALRLCKEARDIDRGSIEAATCVQQLEQGLGLQ